MAWFSTKARRQDPRKARRKPGAPRWGNSQAAQNSPLARVARSRTGRQRRLLHHMRPKEVSPVASFRWEIMSRYAEVVTLEQNTSAYPRGLKFRSFRPARRAPAQVTATPARVAREWDRPCSIHSAAMVKAGAVFRRVVYMGRLTPAMEAIPRSMYSRKAAEMGRHARKLASGTLCQAHRRRRCPFALPPLSSASRPAGAATARRGRLHASWASVMMLGWPKPQLLSAALFSATSATAVAMYSPAAPARPPARGRR